MAHSLSSSLTLVCALLLTSTFATVPAAHAGRNGKALSPYSVSPGTDASVVDSAERTLGGVGGVGGPGNTGGYVFIDSDSGAPAMYSFVDISSDTVHPAGPGTALGLGDDGAVGVVLSAPFPFFGVASTELTISNNGAVVPGTLTGIVGHENLDLSDGGAPAGIYPFWDDLDSETGDVYWKEFLNCPHLGGGSAPCVIVQWDDRPHFPGDSGVGESGTVQMILYTNGNVLFQYEDTDFDEGGVDLGASATVGIRSSGGLYLQYSFNAPAISDELAILFLPPSEESGELGFVDTGFEFGRLSLADRSYVASGDPLPSTTFIAATWHPELQQVLAVEEVVPAVEYALWSIDRQGGAAPLGPLLLAPLPDGSIPPLIDIASLDGDLFLLAGEAGFGPPDRALFPARIYRLDLLQLLAAPLDPAEDPLPNGGTRLAAVQSSDGLLGGHLLVLDPAVGVVSPINPWGPAVEPPFLIPPGPFGGMAVGNGRLYLTPAPVTGVDGSTVLGEVIYSVDLATLGAATPHLMPDVGPQYSVAFIPSGEIFSDGFESGGTTAWAP